MAVNYFLHITFTAVTYFQVISIKQFSKVIRFIEVIFNELNI